MAKKHGSDGRRSPKHLGGTSSKMRADRKRRAEETAERARQAQEAGSTKVGIKEQERAARARSGSAVRRATASTLRVTFGLVGVAVIAGAVVGASFISAPSETQRPAGVRVTPATGDQTRVCAGPLLTAASGTNVSTAANAGSPRAQQAASGGTVTHRTVPASGGSDVFTSTSTSSKNLLAASQSQSAGSEDFAGLATASCVAGGNESWLSAGSTQTGRSSIMSLINASGVDATANVTVFSENGKVQSTVGSGIIVKAGEKRDIPLAGLAPSVTSPVVHVESRGGALAAYLQSSTVRGLSAGGVDVSAPSAPAAKAVTIPGVQIVDGQPQGGDDATNDTIPVVRVFAPGDQDAKIQIGAVPEASGQLGNSLQATVRAGTVSDIPLQNLGAGSYSITVQSDSPVVASARSSHLDNGVGDFAWYASASPLSGERELAVPSGANASLHLANPGKDAVTVTVQKAGGDTRSVTIGAGGAASLGVDEASAYTLKGLDDTYVSVDQGANTDMSSFTLDAGNPLSAPISVYN